MTLLKNYLAVAFRTMVRQPLVTLITVGSLAVGLAAAVMIGLYIDREMSFDQHLPHKGRLYIADVEFLFEQQSFGGYFRVGGPFQAPFLETFSEQVEAATRVKHLFGLLRHNGAGYDENFTMADPSFLDVFQPDVVEGSVSAVFDDLNSIAIVESIAKKYFPDGDALGKELRISAQNIDKTYIVRAIIADLPETDSRPYGILARMDEQNLAKPRYLLNNWGSTSVEQYVLLKPGISVDAVNAAIPEMLDRVIPNHKERKNWYKIRLSPAHDMYLDFEGAEGARRPKLYILGMVAIGLLSIGSINFVNLSIAQSISRGREVALRKIMGASRGQLATQFLFEALLVTFFAFWLALVLVELILPTLSTWLEVPVVLDYGRPDFWLGSIVLILILGILSGAYPAFLVSGWRPVAVLNAGQVNESLRSTRFRQSMVILQFLVTIVLSVAAITIYGQSRYLINLDPGFDRSNLMVVTDLLRGEAEEGTDRFVQRIRLLPNVVSAGLSVEVPSDGNNNWETVTVIREGQEQQVHVHSLYLDAGFISTYDLTLLSGRSFDRDRDEQSVRERRGDETFIRPVVINRALFDQMGLVDPKDAVGYIFSSGARRMEVIGVVENAFLQNAGDEHGPEIFILTPGSLEVLTIRYTGATEDMRMAVDDLWTSMFPEVPYGISFVEQMVEEQFEDDVRASRILLVFSVTAVVIAVAGLFAMASYAMTLRTKEIGIRKTLGARSRDILALLAWEFTKPLLFSAVLAMPIVYYALSDWLQSYAFRLPVSEIALTFVGIVLLVLVISQLAVGGHVWRTARAHPIQALRYE